MWADRFIFIFIKEKAMPVNYKVRILIIADDLKREIQTDLLALLLNNAIGLPGERCVGLGLAVGFAVAATALAGGVFTTMDFCAENLLAGFFVGPALVSVNA